MAKKDRYRRVRRALRRIKDHIRWIEQTQPNRAARRRAMFEGVELHRLYAQLNAEKRKVG